jgi:hypothetical protein
LDRRDEGWSVVRSNMSLMSMEVSSRIVKNSLTMSGLESRVSSRWCVQRSFDCDRYKLSGRIRSPFCFHPHSCELEEDHENLKGGLRRLTESC